MGKGKYTKRVKLKKGHQTKSKIAAYIKGKIKLSRIMHPSRITTVNRKQRFNFDIVNQSNTSTEQVKSIKQPPRKPPLKDYISGKVSVSEMLPPGKMNEIPPKTRQLQIFQMQNFFSPEWNNRYCGKTHENCTNTRHAKSKKIANEKHAEEKSKKYKVETPQSRISCGDSVAISELSIDLLKSVATNDTFLPMEEINFKESGDVGCEKHFLTRSCSKHSCSSSTDTTINRNKSTPGNDAKMWADFQFTPVKEVTPPKPWNGFKLTPENQSSKIWNANFKPSPKYDPNIKVWTCLKPSPKYPPSISWSNTTMKRTLKDKEDMIKAHEDIERHFLRQIIHLRNSRDKYKKAFKDIRTLVKILSERSNYSCFKRLNID